MNARAHLIVYSGAGVRCAGRPYGLFRCRMVKSGTISPLGQSRPWEWKTLPFPPNARGDHHDHRRLFVKEIAKMRPQGP